MKTSIDGISGNTLSNLQYGSDEKLQVNIEKVFRGIWVPLITPFHHQRVDLHALQRLTESIISHGLQGLVVCGTTGEASALSQKEQMNVLMAVKEVVGLSYPILMGINGIDTASVVKKVSRLNSFDIAGYLVSVPPYVKPSQYGIMMHFEKIAQVSRFPLVLYNNPSRTGVNMEVATSLAISKNPQFVGLKESCGDVNQLKELAINTPLRIFAGDDKLLLQTMNYGGVGAISAAAHIRPDLYVRIYRLTQEGKHAEAFQLFNILLPLIQLLFEEPSPGPIKALLAHQGVIREELRLPMTSVSKNHRIELIQALERVNLLTL